MTFDIWSAATCRRFLLSTRKAASKRGRKKSGDESPHSIKQARHARGTIVAQTTKRGSLRNEARLFAMSRTAHEIESAGRTYLGRNLHRRIAPATLSILINSRDSEPIARSARQTLSSVNRSGADSGMSPVGWCTGITALIDHVTLRS